MDPSGTQHEPKASLEDTLPAASNCHQIPSASRELLETANRCLLDERLDEARGILQDLDRRHPGHVYVLEALLELHWQEDDHGGYLATAKRLLKLEPNQPQSYLRMAGCFERQGAIAAALWYFRRYLGLANDSDPLADQVRKSAARMEVAVAETLEHYELSGEDALDCLALYDEVRTVAEARRVDVALELAEELTTRWPDFLPGWNQLCWCWYQRGDVHKAVCLAECVLDRDPHDEQARQHLTLFRGNKSELSADSGGGGFDR